MIRRNLWLITAVIVSAILMMQSNAESLSNSVQTVGDSLDRDLKAMFAWADLLSVKGLQDQEIQTVLDEFQNAFRGIEGAGWICGSRFVLSSQWADMEEPHPVRELMREQPFSSTTVQLRWLDDSQADLLRWGFLIPVLGNNGHLIVVLNPFECWSFRASGNSDRLAFGVELRANNGALLLATDPVITPDREMPADGMRSVSRVLRIWDEEVRLTAYACATDAVAEKQMEHSSVQISKWSGAAICKQSGKGNGLPAIGIHLQMEQSAQSDISLSVFGLAEPLRMSGELLNSTIRVRAAGQAGGDYWQMTGVLDADHKIRGEIQKYNGHTCVLSYDIYAQRIDQTK